MKHNVISKDQVEACVKDNTILNEKRRESCTSAAKQRQRYTRAREEPVIRLNICRGDRRMKSDTE